MKSSSDRTRSHHFTLYQVHPPIGVQGLVASLFAESSPTGLTLGELWDRTRDLVSADPDLRLKIDEQCIHSLGEHWEEAGVTRSTSISPQVHFSFST